MKGNNFKNISGGGRGRKDEDEDRGRTIRGGTTITRKTLDSKGFWQWSEITEFLDSFHCLVF
jgi:hypothetical protein